MNAKLLNFLLIVLLSMMAVQWLFPKPTVTEPTDTVLLTVSAADGVTPATPTLFLKNTTQNTVQINTCSGITIIRNGQTVANLPKDFCQTIRIAPTQKITLSLEPIYKLFATSADFTFQVTSVSHSPIVSYRISDAGFFRGFFRTFFFTPVYNLFVAILSYLPGHSLAIAIVLLTVLVRIILIVPQQHMMQNNKKMQAIQPKIKALQKEFKNDNAKMG